MFFPPGGFSFCDRRAGENLLQRRCRRARAQAASCRATNFYFLAIPKISTRKNKKSLSLRADKLPSPNHYESRDFFSLKGKNKTSCAASRARSRAAASTVRPTRPSTRSLLCPTMQRPERISLSVVRGVNRAIRSHLATLSARLARA